MDELSKFFDHMDYHFHTITYPKDTMIIHPLEKNTRIIFILEGTVSVYAINEDGIFYPVGLTNGRMLLGDIEFVIGGYPSYYVETKSEVKAIYLDLEVDGEALHHDITFMNYIMKLLVEKIQLNNHDFNPGIEERLILYMKECHEITDLEEVSYKIHCSKRQLLRVLKKLVDLGKVKKLKRGTYIYDFHI